MTAGAILRRGLKGLPAAPDGTGKPDQRAVPNGGVVANVAIPTQWYSQGRMPRLCARHGGPASRTVRRTFYTPTPPWVWLLVLVSLLVAAIVALAIRTSLPGHLPGCARCVSDRRVFVGSVLGGLTAGVLLFVAGVAAASGVLVGLGMLVVAAALLGSMCGDQFRVRGRLRKDKSWIELSGTAPAFAAEMVRGLQQAHAASPAPQPAYAAPQQPWPATAPQQQPAFGAPQQQPAGLVAPTTPYTVQPRDILPGR
jgi:hypothetical protein